MSEEAKAEALEPEPSAPAAAEAPEAETSERPELLTPELIAQLWKVVPVLWLAGVFVAGYVAGVQVAFLTLAAGVLTLVIALMWSSVQSLTGGASIGFEEALGMGAPSKVEEEKRSVLRALKDLEYERGVGKISPEDYAELSAKYRAEAKRLIQSVDDALGPARSEVERAIEKRLERSGLSEAATEAPAEVAAQPLGKPDADAEQEDA
ncbi:MAG TPA: hypothetical protein VHB79_15990 [Polyangiaceae bacterium]|nr:hypothetical protein [Polyangiaceae bacterium]